MVIIDIEKEMYGDGFQPPNVEKEKPFELTPGQELKFKELLATEVERIERTYMRKPHREYFLCGAECCKIPFTTSRDFDDCCEICFVKMMDKKRYVESEFGKFNHRFRKCIKSCSKASRKMMKTDQCLSAQDAFDACSRKCMTSHAFILNETVMRIAENLTTQFDFTYRQNVKSDESE